MEFVIGGLAATSAGIFTNPLEVVKHHLELTKKSQMNIQKSYVHAGLKIAKQDGLKSLQKGLSPALGSYLVSYGIKLGTYEFSQNRGLTTDNNGKTNVVKSVGASTVGGLAGQYLSNPFYMVKAKHDMEAIQSNSSCDNKSGYMDTVKRIFRENGIRGFFRGATTSLPRALIGTSQLTSFAVAMENLEKFEMFQKHSFLTTILAGTVAGVVLSMAMTPFDLVLTKMYKQAIGLSKPSGHTYSGYVDCMKKIYTKKGLKPFYSGMAPLYMKLGPHTVLCLVFWEEYKGLYRKMDEDITSREQSFVPHNRFYRRIGFLSEDADLQSKHKFFDAEDRSVYWN